MQSTEFSGGEVVLFQGPEGTRLDVHLQAETVWLTQKQMAELFGKDVRTVNEHLKNVFREGELAECSAIRKFRITASDGKSYDTAHYNLDVIISVGYRVKSQQGTRFRQWATQVLHDHVVKGYTLNEQRLREESAKLREMQQTMELLARTLAIEATTGQQLHVIDYNEAIGIVGAMKGEFLGMLAGAGLNDDRLHFSASRRKIQLDKLEWGGGGTAGVRHRLSRGALESGSPR